MISARIRYAAMLTLATAVFTAALARLLLHDKLGAALGLAATAVCLYGCRRIQRTTYRRQEEQRLELEALTPGRWAEPWAGWCCERGWLTRGDLHHPDHCTRAQQR
ncbi:hypothetical protein ABZX72_29410 [Streptomyces cyaneofuscatus]|uniref:hypothetical protein n=1 Tax=Streptomyces cyaneofuscatus TaxID=66883 RepID=UPI0033AAF3AD